jgi:hypothetical protein
MIANDLKPSWYDSTVAGSFATNNDLITIVNIYPVKMNILDGICK